MKPTFLTISLASASLWLGPQLLADCCESHSAGATHPAEAAPQYFSDTSLYLVDALFQNAQGEAAPLSQLQGKAQLVAMVYTSCHYACPRIIADLKALESALSQFSSDELGIALITIDPERDTVARLQEYARQQKLAEKRWSLLRGDPGDIRLLANLLGVRYKATPDGEFSHSNIITLLNPKGEVVFQLKGLGAPIEPLVQAARNLLSDS